VCFVYTTTALWMFFFGGERQFTHTERTFFVLIKCGIDTVTANRARELSICAHRLDWFEKVALKVTSKETRSEFDDSTRQKRSHNKSARLFAFHAFHCLALIPLIDLWRCGG
jgi:hypothetical protein